MNNQPAFPLVAKDKTGMIINMGMSLRDYFAAQAMQAFINRDEWQSTVGEVSKETAFNAYAMADAMLEER